MDGEDIKSWVREFLIAQKSELSKNPLPAIGERVVQSNGCFSRRRQPWRVPVC